MGKNQINILKTLGYKDTQEEGAILEHPYLDDITKYVWSDDKFQSVLSGYSMALVKAERKRIAASITT